MFVNLQHQPLFVAFAFGIGACIGSFLNVCGYRLPREISVVSPGSYCTECGTPIPARNNIPILGWFLLRGRAACCGAAFSPRYAIVELLTAVFFAVTWWILPLPLALAMWVFFSLLMVGVLTDLDFLIIPDEITLGGTGVGLLASVLVPALHGTVLVSEALQRSAVGAVSGALVLWVIALIGKLVFRKDAMGMGDVKLMGCIGAFTGWEGALFTIATGSMIGAVGGVAVLLLDRRKLGSFTPVPFGPALSVAALIWPFAGERLWQSYVRYVQHQLTS
jgi:leader peptidase (prepilin peptidase)/N-methyltransferase